MAGCFHKKQHLKKGFQVLMMAYGFLFCYGIQELLPELYPSA